MDIETFVHGVPNGQSFWGKEEDRNYFGNFYGQNNSDAVKYLIQMRSSNSKTYCYYNYLVYQKVIGSDGREGSYFGLSIRLDSYYKDFMGIYKILDTVFTAHVLNKILKVQNGNYKYIIADFVSASEMMGNIHKATWQLLQSTLTNESVCSLGSFAVGGGRLLTRNLYEITANDVEATVTQYGKIALSPYYPTVREKGMAQQYDSKLQSVKQQYEEMYSAEINAKEQTNRSLNNSLASVQRECTKLQESITQKDKIIAQKESDITNLEYEIKQIRQTQKAIKNLNLIKTPIAELANILGGQKVQGREENIKQKKENPFSVKGLISLANLAMLLVVLIVVVSLLFKVSPKENKSVDSFEDLQDSISILNGEIENLKSQLLPYENENTSTGQVTDSFSSENTSTKVRISVTGYNEGKKAYLQKDIAYIVTVLNSQNPDDGSWSISGGRIEGDIKGKSIKFVPESDDKVTITYTNPNGENKSRSLIVQN